MHAAGLAGPLQLRVAIYIAYISIICNIPMSSEQGNWESHLGY